MTKRQEGFYWVVYLPKVAEEWTIADYMTHGWFIIGTEEMVPESDLLIGAFISPPRSWLDDPTRDRDPA